jgi:hypothetical protein
MERRGYATGGWTSCFRDRCRRIGGFARLKKDDDGVGGGVIDSGVEMLFPIYYRLFQCIFLSRGNMVEVSTQNVDEGNEAVWKLETIRRTVLF